MGETVNETVLFSDSTAKNMFFNAKTIVTCMLDQISRIQYTLLIKVLSYKFILFVRMMK